MRRAVEALPTKEIKVLGLPGDACLESSNRYRDG